MHDAKIFIYFSYVVNNVFFFENSGCFFQHLTANVSTFRGCLSHIILNEVHERDLNTDILLKIVKGMLSSNAHLKVILMSATINGTLFNDYFDSCESMEIPGRLLFVETLYLGDVLLKIKYMPPSIKDVKTAEKAYEDAEVNGHCDQVNHDLLSKLIDHIQTSTPMTESILVFFARNRKHYNTQYKLLQNLENCNIIMLHSQIEKNLDRVFITEKSYCPPISLKRL